jgi:hypothetical protein
LILAKRNCMTSFPGIDVRASEAAR